MTAPAEIIIFADDLSARTASDPSFVDEGH